MGDAQRKCGGLGAVSSTLKVPCLCYAVPQFVLPCRATCDRLMTSDTMGWMTCDQVSMKNTASTAEFRPQECFFPRHTLLSARLSGGLPTSQGEQAERSGLGAVEADEWRPPTTLLSEIAVQVSTRLPRHSLAQRHL